MNWKRITRTTHRWASVVFTLAVVANFAVMSQGQPPVWVSMLPLPPLFVMFVTGAYLFVLPYLNKPSAGQLAD
ncbi:MAG: hypothetical protein R3B40_32160 [Polyangiales bacterium]